MRWGVLGVVVVAAASLAIWLSTARERVWTQREVLDAIRAVESRGQPEPPDGDGGRAIGPYQIHRGYWQDAVAFDPELGGTYEDCRDLAYAERVIAAYMRRFVPEAWRAVDAEVIARTHNGGPRGAERASTLRYWERVRSVLEAASRGSAGVRSR